MHMLPIGQPHPQHPDLIATDRVEHGYQVFDGQRNQIVVTNDGLRWWYGFAAQVREDDAKAATPEVIEALIAAEAALQVRLPNSSVLKQVKAALDKAVGIREKKHATS